MPRLWRSPSRNSHLGEKTGAKLFAKYRLVQPVNFIGFAMNRGQGVRRLLLLTQVGYGIREPLIAMISVLMTNAFGMVCQGCPEVAWRQRVGLYEGSMRIHRKTGLLIMTAEFGLV